MKKLLLCGGIIDCFSVLLCIYVSYSDVTLNYLPLMQEAERLQQEIGSIHQVSKSIYEFEDVNGYIRLVITTENDDVYLVKVNTQNLDEYEILEKRS